MTLALGIVGILILLFLFYDILRSTLSVSKNGPITRALTFSCVDSNNLCRWTLIVLRPLKCRPRFRSLRNRILSNLGSTTLVVVICAWYLLLWIGWTLVFSWDPLAIRHTKTGAPTTTIELIYFVGATITTLGIGDFTPDRHVGDGVFQILTALCTAQGLLLTSLTATFPENLSDVISATSEASKLRHLAVKISVMGSCPTDILRHGWNGQDFSTLDSKLKDLIHPICMDIHTRNLYPILFNYHFLCRDNATRLQMAILDEVLTIFLHALETEAAPDCLILMTLRNGLSLYLQTVGDVAAISKSAQNPSATIDFDTLSAIGIPLIRNEEFQSFLLQDSDIIRRRKTWMALLESGTWTWDRIIS